MSGVSEAWIECDRLNREATERYQRHLARHDPAYAPPVPPQSPPGEAKPPESEMPMFIPGGDGERLFLEDWRRAQADPDKTPWSPLPEKSVAMALNAEMLDVVRARNERQGDRRQELLIKITELLEEYFDE